MKIPDNLLSFIRKEEQFFIAAHVNPDGDALGSAIALSMALESFGKKTTVYDKDPIPEFYKFLPGHERFTTSKPESQISNLILLDCNDLERANLGGPKVKNSAVIDHHETETGFGDIKWVEPRAPATGMMIYYLLRELGVEITKDIATNLYSAIAIDTGTFRYSNTTTEVLGVASELIGAGADPSFIAGNLYETWSENRFRLLMKVLNTLEINGDTASIVVTQDMLKETGASVADTEHFSSFPRMLKTIELAVLFREIESNYYKVSMRSKGKINVARIAEMFGGGGHRNAAGYTVRLDIKAAKEELLRAITSSIAEG